MSMNSVWQKSRVFRKTHVYEFHLRTRTSVYSLWPPALFFHSSNMTHIRFSFSRTPAIARLTILRDLIPCLVTTYPFHPARLIML
jgi:hypothetical protein